MDKGENKMVQEKIAKMKALAFEGEDEGGAEIIEVIIVMGFAIGLGVGLFFLQGIINDQLNNTAGQLQEFFEGLQNHTNPNG